MATVTVVCENFPRRTVTLKEAVTTVGRSVDNVLEVPDPNISRRHCVIERRDTGEFVVTDCNSSNGTRVNGERVLSHDLRDGDRIEVGSTVIYFAADLVSGDRTGEKPSLMALLEESHPDEPSHVTP